VIWSLPDNEGGIAQSLSVIIPSRHVVRHGLVVHAADTAMILDHEGHPPDQRETAEVRRLKDPRRHTGIAAQSDISA
jgi:hypothetical protein